MNGCTAASASSTSSDTASTRIPRPRSTPRPELPRPAGRPGMSVRGRLAHVEAPLP